ncbi:MAG: phosphoribosylanthranilate isomerase [Ruminococcaceae bacterium]|nr:phosphoribosylanthranilate isomerase [Oscillospiraceae bacterium]
MITQIYGIKGMQETLDCIEAGADNVGFVAGSGNFDFGVTPLDELEEIFQAVGDTAVKVAIVGIASDTYDEIFDTMSVLSADIFHLTGKLETNAEFYEKFKGLYPDKKLMQAVAVVDASAVEKAQEIEKYCDLIILDSVANDKEIGAAGITHDWNVSRKIVKTVSVPVILAGGLGVDNVADAIKAVSPFGVDSLTRTNKNFDKTLGKDIEAVREFCKIAHSFR